MTQRQISQYFVDFGQSQIIRRQCHLKHNVALRQHRAFRHTRGAGRIHQRREVTASAVVDDAFKQSLVSRSKLPTDFMQVFDSRDLGMVEATQPTPVKHVNFFDMRKRIFDLQIFVELFFILDKQEPAIGIL